MDRWIARGLGLSLMLLVAGCSSLGTEEDACGGSGKPQVAAVRPMKSGIAPIVDRRVMAFYYPWFGTPTGPTGVWRHWNPNLANYGIAHQPQIGFYDSKDLALLRQHVRAAKAAGIDTLIASWWGASRFEDEVLQQLLPIAQSEGMAVSVLIETGLACEDVRSALRYLVAQRMQSPAWLRANGKPVVFFYSRVVNAMEPDQFSAVFAEFDVFTMGDTMDMAQAEPFDGVFAYNPVQDVNGYLGSLPGFITQHRGAGRIIAAAVVPGYDDTAIRTPGLRVDRQGGQLYRRMWESAGTADWVTITTFNEWQEGSEIEPSVEHGGLYQQLTGTLGAAWRR